MPEFVVKDGSKWKLIADYSERKMIFYLRSKSDMSRKGFTLGGYPDISLTPAEWRRLVSWVELQQAEEEIQKGRK